MTKLASANTGRFDALDGLRAAAAFAVLGTHVGFNTARSVGDSWYAPFLARLDFGVTVFFLLSGFLLYRPFVMHAFALGDRPSVRRFWWRRALRILPAYWLAVAVTLGFLSSRHASASDWSSYLVLIQTYNSHNVDPSLTQMWTLSVELSFYLVLPLLAAAATWLGRRVGRPLLAQFIVLASMVGGAAGFRAVTHQYASLGLRALLWMPAYLDWFAGGMLLAVISAIPSSHPRGAKAVAATRAIATDWITCCLIGLTLWWFSTLPLGGPLDLTPAADWQWTAKHLLYLGAAMMFLLPFTVGVPGGGSAVLSSPAPRFLGELSYGIYLWHLPLLLLIYRVFDLSPFQGSFWKIFLGAGAAATGVAAVSWFGMERPLLRRFSRSWRSPSGNDESIEPKQNERARTQPS
jgi:peptidoglycan/LPS O-acetylase OafA/YrhL